MTPEQIMIVTVTVVALTQFIKWAGYVPERAAPIVAAATSLIGVVLFAISAGTFTRATVFSYFAAFVVVMLSAAGVYGYTRAAAGAVTNLTNKD